jgi:hypothetical protein
VLKTLWSSHIVTPPDFVLIVEPNSVIVALQTWADYCRADHGDNSVIVAPLERKEQIFGMKW